MGLLTIPFVREGVGFEEDDVVIRIKRSDPYYQRLNKLFSEGDHYMLHQDIILPQKMKQEWETAYDEFQHHLSTIFWDQLNDTGDTLEWFGNYYWVPANQKSLASYWTRKLASSITHFHIAQLVGSDKHNNS